MAAQFDCYLQAVSAHYSRRVPQPCSLIAPFHYTNCAERLSRSDHMEQKSSSYCESLVSWVTTPFLFTWPTTLPLLSSPHIWSINQSVRNLASFCRQSGVHQENDMSHLFVFAQWDFAVISLEPTVFSTIIA